MEISYSNIDDIRNLPSEEVTLWVTPSCVETVKKHLPFIATPVVEAISTKNLIVIGGGKYIDYAKIIRAKNFPDTKLIAAPSLWGSGSEASPIALSDKDSKKEIFMGEEFTPDEVLLIPELWTSISQEQSSWAIGDSWSHALEGLLSPLNDGSNKEAYYRVLKEMLYLAPSPSLDWFIASAKACKLQSKSGVGLIHGIAHSLEGIINKPNWGHARLCSTFLYPVMKYNALQNCKFKNFMEEGGLDSNIVLTHLESMFNVQDYDETIPFLEQNWKTILRDPCSRINCALVRPSALSFFTNKEFISND